ncbi:UDP-2,3-diacylglucosamine diphosphatase [Aestuariirhabdus sp. Z084]|uniref:UDP-2,3-diacylglucosamine diphosphatase n=1 Tax=Aestuariirhabdus haliotis TaxID=2918751 RepID=UPI00201B3C69|nr:UDP-2,3-diacylglucosamine diphosphatase [Aestuariirhabdus haliotis]MCL6414557.1 UDP-2,3-diacylglucosamine diphosphatase [Aestuariirhabdus haliotis]MCL6418461.1 UDP-2,3-diacylglucosamine diphosphatase [Aestuariirhabdus haliotis]
MTTLFISDLHLQEERPAIGRAFLQLLENCGEDIEALYILGDFFEYWVGDDGITPFQGRIADALKQFSKNVAPVYFMHGNRDLLIGKEFAKKAGCTILPDPTVVDLYGEPTLLMHGDSLCTLDIAYQRFRRVTRNPIMRWLILHLPLSYRTSSIQKLRTNSQQQGPTKSREIMDVTPAEVERIMAKNRCKRLIHGHTHRPARHPMNIQGEAAERIVLGDWEQQGWLIRATPDSLELESFEIEETQPDASEKAAS